MSTNTDNIELKSISRDSIISIKIHQFDNKIYCEFRQKLNSRSSLIFFLLFLKPFLPYAIVNAIANRFNQSNKTNQISIVLCGIDFWGFNLHCHFPFIELFWPINEWQKAWLEALHNILFPPQIVLNFMFNAADNSKY